MRRQNLALVLSTVAASGPLSRAAVAGRVGLTRAAVSSLVDELLGAGLLVEGETQASGKAGRPGRALALHDRGPAGLGLEVGPAHLGACVVDLRGEPRVWHRVPALNRSRPAEQVLGELAELAAASTREALALGLRIEGAVLAVPGVLGPAHDTVEHAPNLGWHGVVPAEHWPAALRAPELENEANLGALAELWRGGEPADTLVHISAETGIGAALVIDGRLFRGAAGYAGELGHVPVHTDGPRCSCGARGCLEQYAGARAVLRAAGVRGTHRDPVAALVDRAREGHAPTLAALTRAGEAFGTALTSAVNLVDPAAIVLGGAYTELAPWLLPAMTTELTARVRVRPWDPDTLRPSRLGRRGPLLGAALLTTQRVITDPARLWD
ncbi:ROK family protein [Streptacidiphilus pinicola]|uniref:ROK family protein n=1 Tax=Streptacidiphilus pinicola TaxID=2219663 RepID=A0A2X0IC29_9ACTN|nr:ROK family transcriptional regulator [Streptacidiphilus pinicola]RAG82514.1 ROK family protein [Streptacidiphilus pinicola]